VLLKRVLQRDLELRLYLLLYGSVSYLLVVDLLLLGQELLNQWLNQLLT
jgi:hypothetical protein